MITVRKNLKKYVNMGLFNRFKRSGHEESSTDANGEGISSAGHMDKKTKLKTRRKSFFQFIKPSDVTTESLQVWAGLPQKIRQDPSMVSFQMEHDRLHGKKAKIYCYQMEMQELLFFFR